MTTALAMDYSPDVTTARRKARDDALSGSTSHDPKTPTVAGYRQPGRLTPQEGREQ